MFEVIEIFVLFSFMHIKSEKIEVPQCLAKISGRLKFVYTMCTHFYNFAMDCIIDILNFFCICLAKNEKEKELSNNLNSFDQNVW